MFSDYRGIPREAMYLIWASILPSLAAGMFYTDIPYFLNTVQGISLDFVGFALSLMGVSTVVTSIPLGMAADRYGRKKMLIIGNVIASGTIAAFALTTNLALLMLAAVLEGVSESAFSASGSALMADKVSSEKDRTRVFSLFGFATGIPFGIGSFIIPVVAVFEALGYSTGQSHTILYVMLAGLSLASTLLIFKVRESRGYSKVAGLRGLITGRSRGPLVKYVLTGSIIAFGAGMVIPLMASWFSYQYGIPDSISGPILGVSNILIGVSTLASPFMARKMGLIKAIVVTQAASTIFMFGTPLSPNYAVASLVYTMRSFLMNMANPLQQSMIMGIVAKEERGVASGINTALWRLPNSLSIFIGAWLFSLGYLSLPFFLAGLFYIVSIALFWFFFRCFKMPEETQSKPAG